MMSGMVDYYPLIAKAIAGLEFDAPGESRLTIYERARVALAAELRRINPPLTEAEIARERQALEKAVRTAEAEATQRAREARSRNEISVGATSMIITGSATGRLVRTWSLRIMFSPPSNRRGPG